MPRKTSALRHVAIEYDGASMRPRPDAAENRGIAANLRLDHVRFNEAAARCRGKHAGRGVFHDTLDHASMRPRPDAAENLRHPAIIRFRSCCFNEAAARCRGKPRNQPRNDLAAADASMRPRPDAAENHGPRVCPA